VHILDLLSVAKLIPPSKTILLLVKLFNKFVFTTSKNFFFLSFSKIGLKKIVEHPCFSLILSSMTLWADPRISKLPLTIFLNHKFLLNEGIYKPLKLYLIAVFKLLEM
jgi:hypothetical protein